MTNFEPVGFSELDLPYWDLPIDNGDMVGGYLTQDSSLSANDSGTVVIAQVVGIGEYLNYGDTALIVWVIDGADGLAPPLRQRQRDDGLATDAKQQRGSGTSLQTSLRRGGRIYY